MARAVLREIVFGLATTGLLMGCVEGGGKTGTGDSAALTDAPAARKATGQEIEAPDIFQTTDSALWDGRPSLGGIWVASPDVTDPQRVVMFNPATGKTITGALFRRERENPGPKLQLSSDAAEALGILAGAPTEIRVTALKKEQVAEEAPTAAAPAEGAAPADPAAKPGKDGDAAAIASAALAAVDAKKPADGKPAADTAKDPAKDPAAKDADPAVAAAAGAAGVAAAAAAGDGTAAVVDATPTRKTWKERRAEAKAAREAKKRAAAEAKAAAAAAAAGTAVAASGEAPTTSPDAAAAAMAPIEAAPLDARSPEAVAPKEKKTKRKVVGDTAAPATAPEASPVAAPAATGPSRPIQVASFSKEENANRAAEALAKIGVAASPQKSDKGGKAVWGVVVMGDEAMLKKIKDAGFADAYFLK